MALTNLSQITTSGISTLADINLNNITGVAATFTGNVTVGGTLTYDDVTNIDSVGIITARSGINITNGELNFTKADGVGINFKESAWINIDSDNNDSSRNFQFIDAYGTGSQKTLMIIRDTGVVGINTNNPTASLQINSTTPKIILRDNDNGADISVASIGGAAVYSAASDNIFQVANTTEAMRITAAGKIGIGNVDPNAELSVNNASANASVEITRGASGAEYGYRIFGADGSAQTALKFFPVSNGSLGSEVARFDASGRLLLGTTTEGEVTADNFTVADTGHCGITIRSGTSSEGNIFFSDGTSGNAEYRGMVRYEHSNDAMVFKTATSERLRINSNGTTQFTPEGSTSNPYLSIDTSGDNARFNALKSSGDSGLIFTTQSSGTTAERVRITSDGNVLVGTTDATIYNNGDSDSEGIVLRNGEVIDIARKGDLQLTLNRQTNDGHHIGFFRSGSPKSYISTRNDAFCIDVNSSERLRIDSSGRLLKSGQASLTSTSLNHPIQVAAASDAAAIAIFGRAADDIGELNFYEADKSTNLGEIQYRQDHANIRHRVGDIRFATGGVTERLRITSSGEIGIGNDGSFGIFTNTNDRNLILGAGASNGIQMYCGASGYGGVYFGDSNSGNARYSGYVEYKNNENFFRIATSEAERLRIDSAGRLGLNQTSINSSRMMEITQPSSYTSALRINTAGSAGNPGYVEWFAGLSNYKMGVDHNSDNLKIRRDGTEQLRITSAGHLSLVGDNQKLLIGAGDDLQMYHTGSHSFIEDAGTGGLYIRGGGQIGFRDSENSFANMANFNSGGSIDLYYNGSKRFETISTGVKITNNLYLGGSLNGGFSYNSTADTLEFMTTNGGTHSELTSGAYVPSTNAGKDLGHHTKRWDSIYCTGVAFDGNTDGADTLLDDYEEGNYTPKMYAGTGTTEPAYNWRYGQYVKIGEKVTVWGALGINGSFPSASSIYMANFPYSQSWNSNNFFYYVQLFGYTFASGYGDSGDTERLFLQPANTVSTKMLVVTGGNKISATSSMIGSGQRFTFCVSYTNG